ncbi:MAG: DUF2269 family protein [Dehalococcoidia bacterium]
MPDGKLFATFVHLVGVLAVTGASTTFILVLMMMRRSETAQDVRLWSSLAVLAERAFPFATLVLFLSGGYLVSELDFSWSEGWVAASAVSLALMAVAALKINTLKMNAIHESAEDARDGPLPPELSAMVRDRVLTAVTYGITIGQLGIIWNMTTKPGDVQALVAVVLTLLAGVAVALPLRAERPATA